MAANWKIVSSGDVTQAMAAGQDFAAGLEKVMFPDDEQQQPFTHKRYYRNVTSSVLGINDRISRPFLAGSNTGMRGDSAIKKELEEALEGSVWQMPPEPHSQQVFVFVVVDRASKFFVRDCGFSPPRSISFTTSSFPSSPSVCDDDEDVSSIPPDPESNVALEVLRLPIETGMHPTGGDDPPRTPIRRALKVARGLAVMLPEAGEAEWLPTAEALAATGIDRTVTTREWDFALAVLVASVSRTQHLVRRIAEGYATLVLACARHDATFFARTRTHNPDYAGCQTPEMMASKARYNVTRMAETARSRYFSLRAPIRCFSLLLLEVDDDEQDDDDDDEQEEEEDGD